MEKSFKSDKNLILITLAFLVIEILWLLMHLEVIPTPWSQKLSDHSLSPAGTIVRTEKDLKRRGMNSLVWENAYPEETLFYHDSVLTLSESTATLRLEENTEIHLAENTLVTIEPLDQSASSEIRLKFMRGDLRAKNPTGLAKIETDQWTLDLSRGSEVSLRQRGDKNFEVEVIKGQLGFKTEDGTQSFNQNQVLNIQNNQVAKTSEIANDIKFQGPAFERIYSMNPISQIPVAWQGQAEKIEITSIGNDENSEKIVSSLKNTDLNLAPGRYALRLVDKDKVSEVKEIEIWKAPALHLLSPAPRDRLRTEEDINLIWSFIPEAQSYKVVTTDLKTGKTTEKIVDENSMKTSYTQESDIQWKVIGIDANGFEIPSSYSNQFYLRHQPFAAPKLKSPELRIPASDSQKLEKKKRPSSLFNWWSLFIPQANAKDSDDYEAVFAWEKIEGADQYTIEISDKPDFRNPKVSKVVKKTVFIWSGFSMGTYYWRVAAGSSSGRMGVFSEAARVNLTSLPLTASESSDGVLIRKKAQLEKERPEVRTDDQAIIKNVPAPVFDQEIFKKDVEIASEEHRNLKELYLFEWTPLYTGWNLNGENELKVKLQGQSTGAGHFQTEQILSEQKSYFVDVFYAQYKWKAKDNITYPFQEDQTQTDARVQILFGNNKSGTLRGGIVQMLPIVERKDLEKIEIKTVLSVGPSVYFTSQESERFRTGHSLSVLAGSQVFAITNQNHFRYQFYRGETKAISIGIRAQFDGIFYQRSFSTGWGAGLSLGLDSF